jgi:large subunit ribosomal protein L24
MSASAKMKLKKGDQVVVITGKYKGKKGEILKAIPTENRVVVAGMNIAKKHTKPSQFAQGGIEEKEMSIHASNVALVDPKKGTATRIGYKIGKDGNKLRVAKKSGETL